MFDAHAESEQRHSEFRPRSTSGSRAIAAMAKPATRSKRPVARRRPASDPVTRLAARMQSIRAAHLNGIGNTPDEVRAQIEFDALVRLAAGAEPKSIDGVLAQLVIARGFAPWDDMVQENDELNVDPRFLRETCLLLEAMLQKAISGLVRSGARLPAIATYCLHDDDIRALRGPDGKPIDLARAEV